MSSQQNDHLIGQTIWVPNIVFYSGHIIDKNGLIIHMTIWKQH